ncbi:MAG: ATP synthase F1 subunit gamma, partial [Chlorobiales bacterium]|nr:ATP synthase F1 subunit gamma [Chlorobiales bacterium]
MKMVAAARVRRTQDAILSARPYALKMLEVMNSLATRIDRDSHPLLKDRGDEHIEVLLITADKGLCGSFNANVIRSALDFMIENQAGHDIGLNLVGKKGREFFKRRNFKIIDEYIDLFPHIVYEHAMKIGNDIIAGFKSSELDAVYVIYNQFVSMISQKVVIEQLLPIKELDFEETPASADMPELHLDYIFEPESDEILNQLLPRHVNYQIYRALLESAAAENAARMTAMDNATKNAGELIDHLTLVMNRIRQEAITTEILEVVSGADALG